MGDALCRLTIREMNRLLRAREVSSRQVTEALLRRIAEVDNKLNAYVTLTQELALEQADAADRRIKNGDKLPPLLGIPLAIKDLICIAGVRTTAGSKILYNFIPPYDATVIRRLKSQGAVFLGKTNLDQFGMGSSTENSYFGSTHNPWDLERTAGGSSGGSAAATAADECIGSLGTDTGGSIRQPASFCSVVGLKPTYGRVSRFGLIAYGSSFDQIGPITKDVTDCAMLAEAIAGWDENDSTSAEVPVPSYARVLDGEVRGLRIGVPREYFAEGLEPEVEDAVRAAIHVLEGLGATAEEVSMPKTDYAIATYYILTTAEASSNLARYDGVRYGYRTSNASDLLSLYRKSRSEGFGEEVKRRIMLGTYVLSAGYYDAYYRKAQQVRMLMAQEFAEVFKKVDVLATPTSPTPPFRLGEKLDDPLKMYLSDIYTISANLAGVTSISVPCAFSSQGLPISIQLTGKAFDEETVLKVAYAYEQQSQVRHRKPPAVPQGDGHGV